MYGKSDYGRVLAELLDHAPSTLNQVLMYPNEYEALDRKCKEEYGMTLAEFVEPKSIRIMQPMGDFTILTDSMMAPMRDPTQSWYSRLWRRYHQFVAYVRGKK